MVETQESSSSAGFDSRAVHFPTRLSASAVCLAVDHGIRSHTQEAKKIVTILSWPPPLATRRVSVRGYLFDQLYSSFRLVFESSDDKDFLKLAPTLSMSFLDL